MNLSRREARALTEIERMLRRQDRAFARSMDALNAVRPVRAGHRFACRVSRREFFYLALATLTLAVIPPVLIVALSGPPCGARSAGPATPMAAAPGTPDRPQRLPGCPP
ncbi:hypothetical protein GCM10010156_33510 [Planobispora rosea]|uniref:DUF3040 domain-containing protein n=1 Tax=Planobispora rosea TaxID=35762 RepID=A0A8J3WD28_PLARO|nr:DUF3040 domain-containing protein [Planobispora rosea]GGS71845.1 hypothetical protein GCM10010156_33510 [Planobispora rosea]GIH85534.1 hypothetical protein Pro02_39420 [Planobispora rosea]